MIQQAGGGVEGGDPGMRPAAGLAWRPVYTYPAPALTPRLAQAATLRHARAAARVLAEQFNTPVPEVTSRRRAKGTSSVARRREAGERVHYQLPINERSTGMKSHVLNGFAGVLTFVGQCRPDARTSVK